MSSSDLQVGDVVLVGRVEERGIVRFIGSTHFQAGEWVGVELDKPGSGKNDGSISIKEKDADGNEIAGETKRYFTCEDKKGIFVRPDKCRKDDGSERPKKTKKGKDDAEPKEDITDSLPAFEESQRIMLFNQSGIVRYVGVTDFADGIWIGIEFDQPIGKCDGSVKGKPYFRCNADHGVFLQAPTVDPEAVRQSARRQRAPRKKSTHSGLDDDEDIQADDDVNFTIMDDQGRPMGIDELVSAFEDMREELDNVNRLLEEASERERSLLENIRQLTDAPQKTESSGSGMVLGTPPGPAPPPRPNFDRTGSTLTAKAKVVRSMIEELQAKAGALRAIQAQKDEQVLSPKDIEMGVKVYNDHSGNLDALAKFLSLEPYLLHRKPPADATEFAKRLLTGAYTGERGDVAKEGLRKELRERILERKGTLRRTETKESTGEASAQEIDMVSAIYSQHKGDLDKIAAQCGLDVDVLRKRAPQDAREFAKKLLEGSYTADKSEVAKAALREKLADSLKRQASMLRRAETKEGVGEPQQEDVDRMAKIYRDAKGNLERLAQVCGASLSLLQRLKPLDPEDFARRLLNGDYTGDSSSMAKKQLRERLREDIQDQAARLKRTNTKEGSGPTEVEIAACAKFFTNNKGDLSKIAAECGISEALLNKRPPSGAEDFARSLLDGRYTEDATEAAKAKLRGHLSERLMKRMSTLRRTETKTSAGLSEIERQFAAKIYTENNGDANKIVQLTGVSLKLLQARPPESPDDFAQKFFDGTYSADATEAAKKGLRESLHLDLLNQISKLKPAVLQQKNRVTTAADIDKVAKVFQQCRGHVDNLVSTFGINAELYNKNPCRDGAEFARKLFDGVYSGSSSEIAKAALRAKLHDSLQTKSKTLKRTVTKEMPTVNVASPADVQKFAAAYTAVGGDIDKLCAQFQLNQSLVAQLMPESAEDWAAKLLEGAYTGETSELQKAMMRKKLKAQLNSKRSELKKTTTKEALGEASPADLEAAAKLYTDNGGDLQKISELAGFTLQVKTMSAPASAEEFARNLLAGRYTEIADETAKAKLRSQLQGALQKQSSQLRRTSTKVGDSQASEEDIGMVARLYDTHRGNLERLAAACGGSIFLLRKSPPKDARDFAKKLLEGVYTGETSAMAISELRSRLREDIQVASQTLKRTTTKENAGAASEEDIQTLVKFYDQHEGDIDKIAEKLKPFGVSEDLLFRNQPDDAREFARDMLAGKYNANGNEMSKADLRASLRGELQRTVSTLKRQVTKESVIQVSAEDIAMGAKIWAQHNGDLASIAEKLELSLDHLKKYRPKNADDFAKKLFSGDFTTGKHEIMKKFFREQLQRAKLSSTKSTLKRTTTKEMSGDATPEDIQKIAKLYMDNRGNLERLAVMTGCDVTLMKARPAESPEAFAKALLEGSYLGDAAEITKLELRNRLREDLQRQVSTLRRTTTKESAMFRSAPLEEVQAVAEIYLQRGGELESIVEDFDISLALLKKTPPQNEIDFAEKLLDGVYTADKTLVDRGVWRENLKNDVRAKKAGLKRTNTKEGVAVDLTEKEIAKLTEVFNQAAGDLDKLATITSLPAKMIKANPPSDGQDFAMKLFRGDYLMDQSEANKAEFRKNLHNVIKKQKTNLIRTQTKEMDGSASEEEIRQFAALYVKYSGNLDKLAGVLKQNATLMKKTPPADASDFARRLLRGDYAGDAAAISKEVLRERLREDIQEVSATLKRTTTAESKGLAEEDLRAAVKLYQDCGGNLQQIATRLQISENLLVDSPPATAEDFARQLFGGTYTREDSEHAKVTLRNKLQESLERQASTLRRTITKESMGEPTDEELSFIETLYNSHNGNLRSLARVTGCSEELMNKNPPSNGKDWAKKLFEGSYTSDATAVAKKELRQRLQTELQLQQAKLKRSTTKEMVGDATEEEVSFFARVYTERRGNLPQLAAAFGVSLELMQQRKPLDARDFAKNILAGFYTGEAGFMAKKNLRDQLRENLNRKASQLKRTTTKEYSGLSEEDIEAVVTFYNKMNGDLVKIAEQAGLPAELLTSNPPSDARTFAQRLLEGAYSTDQGEAAKLKMRANLGEDLRRASSQLKRTTTKISEGPATEDVHFFADIYNQCGGNPEQLAKLLGINQKLVEKDLPENGPDFAHKLLNGSYTQDMTEVAKRDFRATLHQQMTQGVPTLKRTTTKEMAFGILQEEDVAVFAKLYTDQRGNLQNLASITGTRLELMKRTPPENDQDFAKKLLEGTYSGDASALEIGKFREQLREKLQRQSSQLKRAETREAIGPSEDDVEMIGKFWDKHGGDLEKMAEILGIDYEDILAKNPEDDVDFAEKLLSGAFHRDKSAAARAQLRDDLQQDLAETKSNLRRTETKENAYEISEDDLQNVQKIYASAQDGNPADLARICNLQLVLLERNPPSDAADFARKLFAGAYMHEQAEGAKASLREKLAKGLQKQQSMLRRTITKERTGEALPEDIEALARAYDKASGNVDKLAAQFKVSPQALRRSAPKNGEDFAKKLLEGQYTGEKGALARAALREQLREDIQVASSKLKRQTTREVKQLSASDLEVCGLIYKQHGGDYAKIANELKDLGISQNLLEKFSPASAEEFAYELLCGAYTSDKEESAKTELRSQLKDGLVGVAQKLKRTSTKESMGSPMEDDVVALAQLYLKYNGDSSQLAQLLGVTRAVMDKAAPTDEQDFARKLLMGAYTQDLSEAAKNELRQQLLPKLATQMSQLKRTVTKEMDGMASEEEIESFAKVYTDQRGNMDKLAKMFAIDVNLMKKNPSNDPQDFARKLLAGYYTGDVTKIQKVALRGRLRDDLLSGAKSLKRTITKEYGGPSQSVIKSISQVYESHNADAKAVAEHFGVSEERLIANPPEDSRDFAERLLDGAYTVEEGEAAKAALREQIKKDLQRTASQLKRTSTKEYSGPTEQELDFMAQLFTKQNGDLPTLANITGVTLKLMVANPPSDERDFARKLLDGTYTADKTEVDKKELRNKLKWEVQVQSGMLKRTTTKELSGEAFEVDIAKFAEVYNKMRGELEQLARTFGANINLIKKSPPVDGHDFAKKLLEGHYTGETSNVAKSELRTRLKDDLQRVSSTLKRTTTKEYSGPLDADVEAVKKIYEENNGDLEQLAQVFEINLHVLVNRSPPDANSFAKALLGGAYFTDDVEMAKAALRRRLQVDLQRMSTKLKKTTTKEFSGPSEEELAFLTDLYNNNGGDLRELAKLTGVTAQLLLNNPPEDGRDFANKVLNGTYTVDLNEEAKFNLRQKLDTDLKSQSQKLKRTTTKEMTGESLPDDIRAFAQVYHDQRGNIDKLMKVFPINEQLIRGKPPTSAEDFAKNLLEGFYTGGMAGDVERSQLRTRLKDDLVRKASQLKRTTTKEYQGHMAEDLKALEVVYEQQNGDLDKLAELCGISVEVVKSKQPKDAHEFATNMLGGVYSMDYGASARARLRVHLKHDLRRTASQLKRTTTKEYTKEDANTNNAQQLEFLRKLYNDNQGDPQKLAALTGCTVKVLTDIPPADAEAFAEALLDGKYHAVDNEAAKADLRSTLVADVRAKMATLRRTQTKESVAEAAVEDIQAFAEVYSRERGNIVKLCKIFNLSESIVKSHPPQDAEDFAKKLLEGVYSAESSHIARSELRTRLQADLRRQMSDLRRTTTKESAGVSASELEAAAKIFDTFEGNFLKISMHCDINYGILEKSSPADGLTFAKGLLAGMYTTDKTEQAKKELRQRLQDDLQRSTSQLKRATTREAAGPTQQEIDFMARVYNNNNGDLEELARLTTCPVELLQSYPPTNGQDFARKLYEGVYTVDKTEAAKKRMRDQLAWEVRVQGQHLKRTLTKEGDGQALEEDIALVEKVWTQNRGNLEKIALVTGARVELLQKNRPPDGATFAKNLLEGIYSSTSGDIARKDLRARLREDLQANLASLRATVVNQHKDMEGPAVTDEEIAYVARVWEESQEGESQNVAIQKVCKIFGCQEEFVLRTMPSNGADFARKLFDGQYTGDTDKFAQTKLRANLREGILRQMSTLKRTETKTEQGLQESDLAALRKVYEDNGGDLSKIAAAYGIPVGVLTRSPPTDAAAFAKKLLEGGFDTDEFEVAKLNLRGTLNRELSKTLGNLRKSTTNEWAGHTDEELEVVGKLFMQHRGNLDAIAESAGLTVDLLRKNPPEDSIDFAKKLFSGIYTSDKSAKAMQTLREKLKQQLAAVSLKRVSTKEWNGQVVAADIELFAGLFSEHNGDLGRLAETFGLTRQVLEEDPPSDGRDFAQKILLGKYTQNVQAAAAKDLRRELSKTLVDGQTPQLKRTQTKQHEGAPDAADTLLIAKVYTQMNGNVEKLSQFFSANSDLIHRWHPTDANDFALKLLSGQYNDTNADDFRSRLRSLLRDDLKASKGRLRRTETKEGPQEPPVEAILQWANIWEEHDGNLEAIASMAQCSVFKLRKNPPPDARTFARNFLMGIYSD